MKFRALMAAVAMAGFMAIPAHAEKATLALVEPVAQYKIYVIENLKVLLKDATAFVSAIKAGDVAKAKALFPQTRMSSERIEPIAELFSDLDKSIDSRADDYDKKEQDPAFPGFHRLEYGLWAKNSTEGLSPVADKLLADIKELNKRIIELTLPPEKVVGGAAVLMEEVAATKISGEEDRYSHTDLWDFKANVDGARKIFDLVKPLVAKDDAAFVAKVTTNFETVETTLAKYKSGNGYEHYDKLTDTDRKVLSAAVNTLAEDLSTLRGKLGLS